MMTGTEQLAAAKILFENRGDAAQKLAANLMQYAQQRIVVLAIPNGGVSLAIDIADALKAELDIIVCRKLALPLNPEGGLGAVADDGTLVINAEIVQRDGISDEQIEYAVNQIKMNVKQRALKYKGERPALRLTGKTAIIVDDGIASGITMTVAAEAVRHRRPKQILAAVPVASAAGLNRVSRAVDGVITCAVASMPRFYLTDFYRDWRDISDEETVLALDQWRRRSGIV
jgi:putative phosphoribosyl transferase